MAQEYTAKFNLDISGLKNSIADATKTIKTANAEFKASTSGMDQWTKSTDGLQAKLSQLDKTLGAQEDILDAYKKQLQAARDAYAESGKRADELRAKLKELADNGVSKTSDEYQKYEKELKEVVSEQQKQGKAVDDLNIKTLEQEAAVGTTQRAIRHYSTALEDLKKDEEKADDATEDLGESIEDAGKQAEKTDGGFTVMKGALADLVSKGIQAAISGLKDLAKGAADAWAAVDEGRDTITAMTGATGEMAESLQGSFNNVAKQVVAPFNDIGTVIGELNTRFGITGQDLEDLGVKVLKFSQLNGTDLKGTIDSVQSAMAAFGVETESAGDVLDILNKAGQNTGVSVDALASSLVANGTAMQELGFGINESIGFLSQLEKNGVDTSAVLGGLKKALQTATKQGKPMSQAMAELQEKMAGAATDTEAAQAASELFGAKAGPAIASAIRDGRLSFDELSATVKDFGGSVDETFENTLDAPDKLKLKLQELKLAGADIIDNFLQENGPAIESLLNNLSENVFPKVVDFAGKFVSGLSDIGKYAKIAEGVIVGLATATGVYLAFATAIKVMKEGWMALTIVQKGAAAAQAVLNAVQAASPIGIVIALIAGLVAAIIVLWNNSEEFREAWSEIWGKITEKASEAWEKIKAVWEVVKAWFDTYVIGPIKDLFEGGWDGIKQKAGEAWDNVKGKFSEGWETLKSGASDAWSKIKGKFSDGWESIKSGAGDAWKKIKDKFAGWGDFWDGLWETVKKKFSDLGSNIADAIGGTVKKGINSVIKLIEGKINSAIGLINDAINLINMIPGVRVSKVGKVSLPRLATGGVLKRGQVGLLEGSGAEAVVPLEKNKQWISRVAADMLGALRRESSVGGSTTSMSSQNYNYTQIINAPEAPSRLEIYRQTKNLLALTEGRS